MVSLVIMANFILMSIFFCGLQFIHGYQVKNGPLLTYRPPWLKRCERDDPKVNSCLTDFFATMFPELSKGISDLNIDGFEPLKLDKLSVTQGSGAVILTGSFLNLTIDGPSNSTPTYTQLDLEKKKLDFGVYLPLLDMKAKYNLKGHILILPIVGNGNCDLLLGGVNTNVKSNISFINVEGREILRIDSMKVAFTLEKISVQLDNLFNGNKVLGLTVNSFLNQHGLEIVSELQEPIGESLAEIFTEIINNIFSKIPTDLWLPKESHTLKYPVSTTTKTSIGEISAAKTMLEDKTKEKKKLIDTVKDKIKTEQRKGLSEDEHIFARLVDEINS